MDKKYMVLRGTLKKMAQDGNKSGIEKVVDIGLRHNQNSTPIDYLNHWKHIARCFAFATHDESFGEFEKEFSIIIRRMLIAEAELDKLKETT